MVLACADEGRRVLSRRLGPHPLASLSISTARHCVHADPGFTASCAALAGAPDEPSLKGNVVDVHHRSGFMDLVHYQMQ